MHHWGETCLVDARDCNRRWLACEHTVREFIVTLPGVIGMKAFGPPVMARFGRPGEREYGLTAIQLLTTSHCALHACEVSGELYLDITSCGAIEAGKVRALIHQYFGRRADVRVRHLERDPRITYQMSAA